MRSTAYTPTDDHWDPVVDLAHCLAAAVPIIPAALRDDDQSCRAWADLMMDAAHSLAAAVAHDAAALRRVLGPPVEVGVNPPWRALLEIAQLICRLGTSMETGVMTRSLAHA